MPKVRYIEHNGTEHEVDAEVGKSVMQTAVDNLIPGIVGDCGGCCSCATCHCYVDAEWAGQLSQRSEEESSILEGALDVQEHSRLSCQIVITPELDGLLVRLPANQY